MDFSRSNSSSSSSSLSKLSNLSDGSFHDSETESNNDNKLNENEDDNINNNEIPTDDNVACNLIIPKAHIQKMTNHILKSMMMTPDGTMDKRKSFKLTQKARKLIHLHCEAYLIDLFSMCKEVQDLKNTKTLKKKTFQFCYRWNFKNFLHK